MTSTEKMTQIARQLDAKKGKDLTVLRVSGLTLLADYFVICSATSTTHAKALADHLEDQMDALGVELFKKEGRQGFEWTLMDYSDVIVHIFTGQTREFYSLEKLWADAEEVSLNEILEEEQ